MTAEGGFDLMQRLTAQPQYVQAGSAWIDPFGCRPTSRAGRPDTGLARDVNPVGRPWQEPDEAAESLGRTDLHTAIDTEGGVTATARLSDAFGDWESIREGSANWCPRARSASTPTSWPRCAPPKRNPGGCSDDEALALATADGRPLDAVAALPIRCAATPSATT